MFLIFFSYTFYDKVYLFHSKIIKEEDEYNFT